MKESVECGGNSTMALLNMPSAEEALMALAVMHNYAPEDLKVKQKRVALKHGWTPNIIQQEVNLIVSPFSSKTVLAFVCPSARSTHQDKRGERIYTIN